MNKELNDEIIKKIENYDWGELWSSVQHINIDSCLPQDEKNLYLSIKAMLLGAWWQDHQSAKELLKTIQIEIPEQIVAFLLSYAYLSIGELELCKKYFNHINDENKWMTEWLDLEWQGRSKQYKEQAKQIEKLLQVRKKLNNTHKIAILQSLDHTDADISHIKKIFIKNKLNVSKSTYDLALSIRLGLIGKSTIVELYSRERIPPFLLYRISHSLISNLDVDLFLDSFDRLLNTKFVNIYTLIVSLMIVMSFPDKDLFVDRFVRARSVAPLTLYSQGSLTAFELIYLWLNNDINNLIVIYNKYRNYLLIETNYTELTKAAFIFYSYIGFLIDHREKNIEYYNTSSCESKEIHVIGESHSLSPVNMFFSLNNEYYLAKGLFLMGAKMYHLAKPENSYIAYCLNSYLVSLPINTDVIFTIGEIDTRPEEGIWKAVHKNDLDIETLINETVGGYIEFLSISLKDKQLNSVTIQGIPAPNYPLEEDKVSGDKKSFLTMIKKVNEKLQGLTLAQGWHFLDVYSATVGEDGMSNKKWHIDGYHLQPLFYTQADQWLIKPS